MYAYIYVFLEYVGEKGDSKSNRRITKISESASDKGL